jgi:transposase
MDNVAFHKSKVVKEALSARNLTALYSPPYSPEYNPVEMAFSVFKAHMRAITPASDATDKPAMLADICDRIARCAVSLSPSKLAAMFRHVWQLMSTHAT